MREFVVGLPMSSATSPISVLHIGHSHIAWLRTYVEAADWFAGAEVRRVVVCQICRRQKWRRPSFSIGAERVVQAKRYLGMFCDETEGISFWRHKRLWNSIRPVFRSDGVHFSDIGNYRFFVAFGGSRGLNMRPSFYPPSRELRGWLAGFSSALISVSVLLTRCPGSCVVVRDDLCNFAFWFGVVLLDFSLWLCRGCAVCNLM